MGRKPKDKLHPALVRMRNEGRLEHTRRIARMAEEKAAGLTLEDLWRELAWDHKRFLVALRALPSRSATAVYIGRPKHWYYDQRQLKPAFRAILDTYSKWPYSEIVALFDRDLAALLKSQLVQSVMEQSLTRSEALSLLSKVNRVPSARAVRLATDGKNEGGQRGKVPPEVEVIDPDEVEV